MNHQFRTELINAQVPSAPIVQFGPELWEGEVSRRSREYGRWVQHSLNQILGLRLAEDGIIGSQTRSAIRNFQKRYGLATDGVVGLQTERVLIRAGASPLRPASVKTGVPALLGRDSTLIGMTLYTDIDLAIMDQRQQIARPMTGIFLPAGYRPQPRLDLILYLHGFKTRPGLTIAEYWDQQRFPHFALREGLSNARRNAVLVAPTLGPKSQAGRLVQRGGLDNFLTQVLAALRAYGPFSATGMNPQLGNLILACHSGGGYPMRRLALGSDSLAGAIRECWGFDCTYNRGDDTLWAQWAKQRSNSRLFIYYIPRSPTEPRAVELQRKKLPNVAVLPTRPRGGHNWVPITHWRERIERAPFLSRL